MGFSWEVWYVDPPADPKILDQRLCWLDPSYGDLSSVPRPDECSTLPVQAATYDTTSSSQVSQLKPAGPLARTLKNSYSKCLAYNPRHPSTSTAKLCLLAGVIGGWTWKRFLHLIRMPNQSELLHMETGLASLIKLVVAWLSHKCSTSLRINTKKNAKTTQSKGGVYMTSDMSSHRYSQHAALYKRKQGKDPSFFYSSATGHWVQNKATNKTNARKEQKNRENVEKRRRNSHWHIKSSIVRRFCSQQQG